MAQILVAGARLKCKHSGILVLGGGHDKLSVSGNGAIAAGDELGLSFALGAPGVTTPCSSANPSGTPTPCLISAPATSGLSSLVSVDGLPVLLDSAGGQAANATDGPSPWSVADAGQQLLGADS